MGEYKVEARASVPYAMYIKANSDQEARDIAERKAESFCRANTARSVTHNPNYSHDTCYDSWSMTVDDFSLDVKSVEPVCRIRTFIPGYDD